jgi:hypothetical protein
MPSTYQPFGLRPAFGMTGYVRPLQYGGRNQFDGIASNYSGTIFKNTPVMANSAGTIITATSQGAIWGVFAGCDYTDGTGSRLTRPYFPGTGSAATINPVALVYRADAQIEYEICATSSLTYTAIGAQANFSNVSAGNTLNGLSTAGLDVSTLTLTGTGPIQITGFALPPVNNYTDAFPIVRVKINQSLVGPAPVSAF